MNGSSGPHNLPAPATTFIGREAELAETQALLEVHRMVTLLGAGGSGKTRLAVTLAGRVLDRYPDGVWLADLAPLSDDGLVATAVASALGLGQAPGQPMEATVTGYLRERCALVVIDNCEHLVNGAADLIERLLAACPEVRVLATSREPLGTGGEATYAVPPLGLPAHEADRECESVRLFADRAALSRPQWRLTLANVAAVSEICVQLDGIPLAIELAAARCRALTPAQIADQLGDRFALLTGGRRAGTARHRTLEASVEWSHTLLSEAERVLLRRLSVFAGGFTLDAARAVCTDPGMDAVDLVAALVDKSLVVPGADEEAPRFRLLETIRQYGSLRLREAGEEDAVRQRHAEYFVALVEPAGRQLIGDGAAEARNLLHRELDNIRAADDWLAETGQADLLLRMWFREFWFHRNGTEGLRRATRALSLPVDDTAKRSKALIAAGECAWVMMDFDLMHSLIGETLATARSTGDLALEGEALCGQGWAAFAFGDETARQQLHHALSLLRPHGEPFWAADALLGLGLVELYAGNADEAQAVLREGISLLGAMRSPALSRSLAILACELCFEGEFGEAEALLAEARPLAAGGGDDAFLYLTEAVAGWVTAARGDLRSALRICNEATEGSRTVQQPFSLAWALWVRMTIEHRHGLATEGLADARETLEAEGLPWGVVWCDAVRAEQLAVAGDLSEARRMAAAATEQAAATMYAARARGRAVLAQARVLRLAGDEAGALSAAHSALSRFNTARMRPEMIVSLEFLGGLVAESGSAQEAVRILAATTEARSLLGYPRVGPEPGAFDADLAKARSGLERRGFDAAWAEGSRLPLEEAAAYAARGRGERKRPATGWESLTPSEAEVVRLVAEGLRNADVAARLFISVATVKTHLARAFAKLGVATRAELAALAARRSEEE